MKSLLISSIAVVIGACLFTSCAQKKETTTTGSTYSGGKSTVQEQRAEKVGDTGPRQDQ